MALEKNDTISGTLRRRYAIIRVPESSIIIMSENSFFFHLVLKRLTVNTIPMIDIKKKYVESWCESTSNTMETAMGMAYTLFLWYARKK